MAETPKQDTPRPGKIRFCWNCGGSMGFVENRYYDSHDTCGKPECERAGRDAYEDARQAAHDSVDDYYGRGW